MGHCTFLLSLNTRSGDAQGVSIPADSKNSKVRSRYPQRSKSGKCIPCSISLYDANNILDAGNVEAAEAGEDPTKTSVGGGNIRIGAAINITANAPIKLRSTDKVCLLTA